jgi:serine/threonine protein phosphatase PrpC
MNIYGISHQGNVRSTNQDAFSVITLPPNIRAAVVCDGMGGANGGSVASRVAVDTIAEFLNRHNCSLVDNKSRVLLEEAFSAANTAIYKKAFEDCELYGMGTTAVAVITDQHRAIIANVGDSRAYHISDDVIQQITVDHSYVQQLVLDGQLTKSEAKNHPQKNLITRALGVSSSIEIDFFYIDLKSGDRLLLCTDGITNLVEDYEIQFEVSCVKGYETFPQRLVEIANLRGGFDNSTVVLIA